MPSLELSYNLQHEVKTWDRFIRSRDKVQNRFLGVPEDSQLSSADPIIDQKLYSNSEETYKRLMASALSLNVCPQSWTPQWPVKSRRNPFLHSPRMVLDLPSIRQNISACSIMDWSATNYLTVAFPKSVYLWHSATNRTLKIEDKNTCCIKWNPEGTALFLANRNGSFKFSDVRAEEDFASANRSPCHLGCFITCSIFHPASPLMYIGCSMGTVCAYHVNKGLHIISPMHRDGDGHCILNLRLSCDGRYLAVASMAEPVFIYDTMNFAFLFTITLTAPSRALAWHPWKRNLLVVSDLNGFMALYDMLAPENPEATYLPTMDSTIMNLVFNPVSAELVVSQRVYFDPADATNPNQTAGGAVQLNVLSSFNRVVDRMEGHTSPVHFLNWNPDGTQLATAGMDETARIWDFLPSSIKQRTKKMSGKLNYMSASLEIGNRMGLAIR